MEVQDALNTVERHCTSWREAQARGYYSAFASVVKQRAKMLSLSGSAAGN
jgi:hypothetical protein